MAKHDDAGRSDFLTRAEAEEMARKAASDAAAATVAALTAVNKQNESPRPNEWRELAKSPPVPLIPCRSHVTNATFDADVQSNIVKALVNYTLPADASAHIDSGGAVPNGLEMIDTSGQKTIQYKQWLYETYWKEDLRTYVMKKFNPSIALPAAAE